MKKIITYIFVSILVILFTYSCNKKKYRYEIHGKVYVLNSGSSGVHDAIWLTDTISFDGDTAYYFNSDGSEVRIHPPYILIDKTLEK